MKSDQNMMERDPSMENMGPDVMCKVPKEVYDALRAWTGAEPSQSALARAVDRWQGRQ